jgi:ribosomal protein S18 acetylase RimI-like enzyme
MSEKEYADYFEVLIADYAKDNVEAGYWDAADALELSRKATLSLLPQGVKTPNHYLHVVRDGDLRVGIVWMKANLDTVNKNGFIYDIAIDESQWGKGYGRKAMQLIEGKARELGLLQMGLHVFAKNKVARNLYESLGYETKSLNMIKDLK